MSAPSPKVIDLMQVLRESLEEDAIRRLRSKIGGLVAGKGEVRIFLAEDEVRLLKKLFGEAP